MVPWSVFGLLKRTLEHEVWKGTVSVRLTYSLGVRRSLVHDNSVPVSFGAAVVL